MASRLQKTLKDRKQAAETKNEYKLSNRVVRKRQRIINMRNKILVRAGAVLAVLGFIYLPGIFMNDKNAPENGYVAGIDSTKKAYAANVIRDNSLADFDNDGISNEKEVDMNLDPWAFDTDGDGIDDYAETVLGTNPRLFDGLLEDKITEDMAKDGKNLKSAYKLGGVVLWTDDPKSRVYGSVMNGINGYFFNNFKGYAQFPSGKYAYSYTNGIHTPLDYDDKLGRWKIEGNYHVLLYDEKLETTNKFGFFGKTGYVKSNWFTDIVAKILPNRGFITAQTYIKADMDVELTQATVVEELNTAGNVINGNRRFYKNDVALEDVALVRKYIEEGYSVPVSLYSEEKGEYIGYIKGYDICGDFIVAENISYKMSGSITVKPMCRYMLDDEGNVYEYTYYEWSGCGFNSEAGDRISYMYEQFLE